MALPERGMEENFYVMYLFVNSELSMTKGKIASQVGHCVQLIVETLVAQSYEISPPIQECLNYQKWRKRPTKILLRATTDELKKLMLMKNTCAIIDDGQTQVPPNSLTVVGFYPSNLMAEFAKDYKLL